MSVCISEPSGSGQCKICEQTAHGVHFGVVSCRACAAFFRRSIVLNKKYICRRADGKCTIANLTSCRHCRLKKCKTLGMTDDNVQYNRDKFSSAQRAEPLEVPGSKVKTEDRSVFDVSWMLNEIAQNFDDFQLPHDDDAYMSKNSLEKMEYALQIFREHQKKDGLEFVYFLDFEEMITRSGGETFRISKWMMHSEEFRKLSKSDKIAIFSSVWMVWSRIERLTMTLEIFGQRVLDEKIVLMSDTHAIYMNKIKMSVSMISDHDSDQILEMFEPLSQKMFDDIARPLLELEPTSIEVTYMLCQVVWHAAGKKFQGEILSAGEKFLDEIANDLHVYYVKQQKISNYASRLARMMAAVQAMQRNQEERQKMFELARLFDVFKVKLSDPIDIIQG